MSNESSTRARGPRRKQARLSTAAAAAALTLAGLLLSGCGSSRPSLPTGSVSVSLPTRSQASPGLMTRTPESTSATSTPAATPTETTPTETTPTETTPTETTPTETTPTRTAVVTQTATETQTATATETATRRRRDRDRDPDADGRGIAHPVGGTQPTCRRSQHVEFDADVGVAADRRSRPRDRRSGRGPASPSQPDAGVAGPVRHVEGRGCQAGTRSHPEAGAGPDGPTDRRRVAHQCRSSDGHRGSVDRAGGRCARRCPPGSRTDVAGCGSRVPQPSRCHRRNAGRRRRVGSTAPRDRRPGTRVGVSRSARPAS